MNRVRIVGEEIHLIAVDFDSYPLGPVLYDKIMRLLLSESFIPDTAAVQVYLMNSMPYMVSKLQDPHSAGSLSLKCALEAARVAGFHQISVMSREHESRLVFEAVLVALAYILYIRVDPAVMSLSSIQAVSLYATPTALLASFRDDPSFPTSQIDELEARKLVQFGNFIQIGLALLPNKKKLGHLLDLITRVAESRRAKKYCTGSKQGPFTSRREALYRRASGVEKPKIADRLHPKVIHEMVKDEDIEAADLPLEFVDTMRSLYPDKPVEVNTYQQYPMNEPNVRIDIAEVFLPHDATLGRAIVMSARDALDAPFIEVQRRINISHRKTDLENNGSTCTGSTRSHSLVNDPQFDYLMDFVEAIETSGPSSQHGSYAMVSRETNVTGSGLARVHSISITRQASYNPTDPKSSYINLPCEDYRMLEDQCQLRLLLENSKAAAGAEGSTDLFLGGDDADADNPEVEALSRGIARFRSLCHFNLSNLSWQSTDEVSSEPPLKAARIEPST